MIRISLDNDSVNLVDQNNVLVGFEIDQRCCEYAHWAITIRGDVVLRGTEEESYHMDQRITLPFTLCNYIFDSEFIEDQKDSDVDDDDKITYSVRFRLINPVGDEAFLTLNNYHTGYYCHGFEAKNNGEIFHSGHL